MPQTQLTLREARRLALAAQGFDRPRPRKANAQHLRRLIHQLNLLQIDYVNVVVPAHYQVPFSRLGPYDRRALHDLVYRQRAFTEQWAHEASIVPMETWPLLRHRMDTHRVRPWGFAKVMEQYPEYVQRILEEVRARGPLAADELPEFDGVADCFEHAWFRSVPRATLEAHFGRGLLAVADRRPDYARIYDLAERVVPAEHHGQRMDRAEAQSELLRQAAAALGVGTAADLADYFRMPVRDARPRLEELTAAGALHRVRVESWREPAYLHPAAQLPGRIEATALLSPFDPLIWFRPRLARLFEFDYRMEIFVPAEKRKWGVYVLPFLFDERLVARVDLKADREGRRLLVLSARREAHALIEPVAEALAKELQTMATWLGLDSVSVSQQGDFAGPLAVALG
jgi:uncharacterized protein YcaQ